MDANTRLKNNKEHLLTVKYQKTGKSHETVLPFSAIYGANNSGKTSFVDALAFCKYLLCSKTRSLSQLEPYRLGEAEETSFFSFTIFIDEHIYQYQFEVDKAQVYHEKLLLLKPSTQKILFDRNIDQNTYTGQLIKEDSDLATIIKTMPKNKLCVSHIIEQNIDNKMHFEQVYKWFKHHLTLISPRSKKGMVDIPLRLNEMNDAIKRLDLSVTGIELEIASEQTLKEELPQRLYELLIEDVKDGVTIMLPLPDGSFFYVTPKEGGDKIDVHKVVIKHKKDNGKDINFELHDESDGTRRVIELLPWLLKLQSDPNITVVIDEVDRSLHTQLSKELIRTHILGILNRQAQSQLIITTHDTHLLDLSFLRKDEFWLVQKEDNGAKLVAFDEFILKSDKKLSKYYLSGSLGGVPFI